MNNEAELAVMSFNIRTLAIEDWRDTWALRKDHVAETIRKHNPDIVGMQEVYTIQAQDLAKRLPAYKWFGLPRRDGKIRGERCTIFYKSSRFELLEKATFWLSKTPEIPGSRSWDSACRRVVTWGKFKDLDSGKIFYLFNTHFDHIGVVARKESAKILHEKIVSVAGDAAVIVTGDFNTTDASEPYQTMTVLLKDSRRVSMIPPQGPEGTTRDFDLDSQVGGRIDYIFVSGNILVKEYAALEDTYGRGRRPSDHLPVMSRVEF